MIPRHLLDHEALLYRDLVNRICAIINETMGARGMRIHNIAFTVISQLYALHCLPKMRSADDLDEPARHRHLTNTIVRVARHFMSTWNIDHQDHQQRQDFHRAVGSTLFTYDLIVGGLEAAYGHERYQDIPGDLAFWRRLRDHAALTRAVLLYANDDAAQHDEQWEAGR